MPSTWSFHTETMWQTTLSGLEPWAQHASSTALRPTGASAPSMPRCLHAWLHCKVNHFQLSKCTDFHCCKIPGRPLCLAHWHAASGQLRTGTSSRQPEAPHSQRGVALPAVACKPCADRIQHPILLLCNQGCPQLEKTHHYKPTTSPSSRPRQPSLPEQDPASHRPVLALCQVRGPTNSATMPVLRP